MTFDDGLLDDEVALARADVRLRHLAESGARVRREAVAAEDAVAQAVQRLSDSQPRAVVAAGPDSRLLRAVLEPVCPVPFVAWPGPGLPGWAGSLDLVVVLAPQGDDPGPAAGVANTHAVDRMGHGRASNTRLNGVSAAWRKLLKPPAETTSPIRAGPAWAPSASPTSCDSDAGVHRKVDNP